jgi:hypothetical protein
MMGACFRNYVGSFVVCFEGVEKHKNERLNCVLVIKPFSQTPRVLQRIKYKQDMKRDRERKDTSNLYGFLSQTESNPVPLFVVLLIKF